MVLVKLRSTYSYLRLLFGCCPLVLRFKSGEQADNKGISNAQKCYYIASYSHIDSNVHAAKIYIFLDICKKEDAQ